MYMSIYIYICIICIYTYIHIYICDYMCIYNSCDNPLIHYGIPLMLILKITWNPACWSQKGVIFLDLC